MKFKDALNEQFLEYQNVELDQKHINAIQKSLLSDLKKSQHAQRRIPMFTFKYVFAPALALLIILFLVNVIPNLYNTSTNTNTNSNKQANHALIQPVSADAILDAMQQSINNSKLHVVIQSKSNGQDTSDEIDSFGNQDVEEIWIDRQNKRSRLEMKDAKGRIRALIIKQGLSSGNTKTYQFITGSMHSFDTNSRSGIWVSRVDSESYEEYIAISLRGNYVQTLKDQGFKVDSKYEESTYEGRPAFKVTLSAPADKMGVSLKRILTIDKATQLPFEETLIETGRSDGTFTSVSKYTCSTDFNDSVFDLSAPAGYNFSVSPKITTFILTPYGNAGSPDNNPLSIWKSEKQLTLMITTDQGQKIQTGDGFLLDGVKYKLYLSNEKFSSYEDALKATNLTFSEVKPHSPSRKLNNAPSESYTLPDVSDINKFGVFQLEVNDLSGKKLYDIKQVVRFNQIDNMAFRL